MDFNADESRAVNFALEDHTILEVEEKSDTIKVLYLSSATEKTFS